MRKLAVKIIQLLDGTPAVYGKRQAGQSVVELALITPILIILLAGLVEIGWFANNYLNLLDVSRTGARRASVLQDNKSPLFWDNRYSYVPISLLNAQTPPAGASYGMPNVTTPTDTGTDVERFRFRWMPDGTSVAGSVGDQPCRENLGYDRLFYNEVICTMITSMEPLSLNPMNGIDDIVVSAFSLQLIDATAHGDWLAPGYNDSQLQMVVVGRYPSNANECNVLNGGGAPVIIQGEGRDPFDFNANLKRDVKPPFEDPVIINNDNDFTEVIGYDAPVGAAADAEKQVGFSMYGNHKIENTFCVGSEWTMTEIEALMNVPSYGLLSNGEKEMLPSQGVVMVEVFWEHEMLLKIPILSPVFTAVGNEDGKMVISVWAAFPQAAVEPHIQFP
jgi:Flp pilus assembly protein TadG